MNGSTDKVFDPTPAGPVAHSIVSLLERLSPTQFKVKYGQLLMTLSSPSRSVYALPCHPPKYPWLASAKYASTVRHEPGRLAFGGSQGGYLSPDAIESVNLRDFNEDLQLARELPRGTVPDRIQRDRRLQRVYTDFLEVAVQGAMNVVNGNLTPLNPFDPKKAHMFLCNNVFFSYGMDGREVFADVGGDEAARISFGKDLEAVKKWNEVDPDGIYTTATALIDYRGYRVVAQSMIPGKEITKGSRSELILLHR